MDTTPLDPDLESLIAGHTDTEICDAWFQVLSEHLEQSRSDRTGWSPTWNIVWSIWRHLGIWRHDGMTSLWLCDQDELAEFAHSLRGIGAPMSSAYLLGSLEEAGLDRLLSEEFTSSRSFEELANKWNAGSLLYYVDLETR